MEAIGQASGFMSQAMNIADKVAKQQAAKPNSFLPPAFQEQADKITQIPSVSEGIQSVQRGEAGTSFANMLKQLAQDVSVKNDDSQYIHKGKITELIRKFLRRKNNRSFK